MQNAGNRGTGNAALSDTPGERCSAKDPLDEEDIPILQAGAQAMAMFVPLRESLFEPFDPARNEIGRLKISLEKVEKHTAAVQENIIFIYEREHRRILRHAKALEAEHGFIETDATLVPGDDEMIMANVEAPMPPAADYSNWTVPTYAPSPPSHDLSPRRAAILWSLYNTRQALNQLAGYAGHAQAIKGHYKKILEHEFNLAKEQSGEFKESERTSLE